MNKEVLKQRKIREKIFLHENATYFGNNKNN